MGDRRVVLILTLVLVLLLLPKPYGYSSETSENEKIYEFLSGQSPDYIKLFDFLSNVVGLDLTKYGVVPPKVVPSGFEGLSSLEFFKQICEYTSTLPAPNISRVDPYGGLAKEVVLNPDFGYNGSRFGTMAILVNGDMVSLKLYPDTEEDFVYSEPQPIDVVGRAKMILQRYQKFQQTYGKDASYIEYMLDMLNSNEDLSINEFSKGNVTFRFSQEEDKSRIQWIYTEEGAEIEAKAVSIKFRNNVFESFHDTWGIYSFSGLDTISFEQAAEIVIEAAQRGELRKTLAYPKTGYVNVSALMDTRYSVSILFEAFNFDNRSVPSSTPRDPFTIYPLLRIYFYFNEAPRYPMGLAVYVWGDTGEVRYCTDVVRGFYYNGPLYDTNNLLQDEQNSKETTEPNDLNPLTVGIITTIIVISIISISRWASKRKDMNVKQIKNSTGKQGSYQLATKKESL